MAFASAADHWLSGLVDRGLIADWRLYRRKFGLASSRHSDVLLLIEVQDMAQLENAFRTLSEAADGTDQKRYDLLHEMIGDLDIGLYRPYPDADNRERVALI